MANHSLVSIRLPRTASPSTVTASTASVRATAALPPPPTVIPASRVTADARLPPGTRPSWLTTTSRRNDPGAAAKRAADGRAKPATTPAVKGTRWRRRSGRQTATRTSAGTTAGSLTATPKPTDAPPITHRRHELDGAPPSKTIAAPSRQKRSTRGSSSPALSAYISAGRTAITPQATRV